jgi:hypothetical protein
MLNLFLQIRSHRKRDRHGHHPEQDEVGGKTQIQREERQMGQPGK